MRFLEDENIKLRAVEPSDAEMLWLAETDSRQWQENGMSAPFSRENLRQYASDYDADPIRSGQLRLICETREGENVGIVDLYDISPMNRTAFVGIYIFEEYRKQGFGNKCLSLLEMYARLLLNLRILGAKISETNRESLNLFESAGYKRNGILHDWLLSGGDTCSLLIYTKKF